MEANTVKKEKNIEWITLVIGMAGLCLVVLSRSNTAIGGFLPLKSYPYLLVGSMVLLSLSLILKLKRESKKKKFSIFLYTREILRTVVGLGIAIYYLYSGAGF